MRNRILSKNFFAVTAYLRGFVTILLAATLSSTVVARIFDITDFGAVGDGKTLSTTAIQSAIDVCSQGGGGTVYFPAGIFLSGTIYLRNNISLNLEVGSVLLGSTRVQDYPLNRCKYVSGTDRYVSRALIWGEGLHNIAITGRGIIDGQGSHFVNNRMARQEWQKLSGQYPDTTRFRTGPGEINRPYMIRLISCRNVLIQGVSLQKPAMWLQHYLNCDFVTIRDIKIFSHGSRNNDMIDIDGSRNVVITGCYGDSDDDGITLKSTSTAPVENVTISDCVIRTRTNAIKAGTESSGGFKDITITNCTIQPSVMDSGLSGRREGLAGIALEIVDGGTLDRVTISNVTIEDMAAPIFLRLGNRGRPFVPGKPKPPVGIFRNVRINNLIATNAGRNGCSILGIKDHYIRNVVLSNVRINFDGGGTKVQAEAEYPENNEDYPESTRYGDLPAYGFFCRHVQGLTLRDVQFDFNAPEARPPLIFDDVRELKIFNFSGQVSTKAAAQIVLKRAQDVLISECRPTNPEVFLRMEKDCERISIVSNDFSRVRLPIALDESVGMSSLHAVANVPFDESTRSLFDMLEPLVNRDEFGLVSMKSFTPDGEIYYTLDGSEPGRRSEKYAGPFKQIKACIIKARVFKDDLASRTAVLELDTLQVLFPQIHPADFYFNKSIEITLTCETPKAEIRYTLNGSKPTEKALLYRNPVRIGKSATLRTRAFKKGYRPSEETSSRYERVPFYQGIHYRYYVGKWEHLPDFFQLTPADSGTIRSFNLNEIKTNKDHYALLMIGFLKIKKAGQYTFYCGSNDGSKLYLDNTFLIDNDGLHGFTEKLNQVYLHKGFHRIEVRYFQGGGGQSLRVAWKGPGFEKQELPLMLR